MKTLKSLTIIDKTGQKVTFCGEFSDDIIDLLKQLDEKAVQGEKYKAMWEEVEGYLRKQELMRIVGKMHSIEQKYFPKPVNKKERTSIWKEN